MLTIELPLDPRMRWACWGLILCAGALALAAPAFWPWRIFGAALVVTAGALLWRRYQRIRPSALRLSAGGALDCIYGDGRVLPIHRVVQGVVRPWLVSARLHGSTGECLDLFVPGASLAPEAHWRLRRALLAFREKPGEQDLMSS